MATKKVARQAKKEKYFSICGDVRIVCINFSSYLGDSQNVDVHVSIDSDNITVSVPIADFFEYPYAAVQDGLRALSGKISDRVNA